MNSYDEKIMEFKNYYEKAKESFNDKNYYEAIEYLTKSLELNPNNAVAYINRGNAYKKIKEYKNAVDDYTNAVEVKPDYAEAYNKRGNVYAIVKEYEKAIEDYTKAIRVNPDSLKVYRNRGNAYMATKQYEKAVEDLKKVIAVKRDYEEAHYNLANAYNELNLFGKSIESFSKVIEIDPDEWKAYYSRGNNYFQLEEFEKAISDYTKVIEMHSNFVEVYCNRAIAYAEMREYEKSAEDFTKAIDIDVENEEIYYQRGNVFFKIKEYNKAIEDYEKAVNICPNYAEGYFSIGNVYKEIKEITKAIEYYTKVIEINPYYSLAYYNIGSLEKEQLQYADAKVSFEKARELFERNNEHDMAMKTARIINDLDKFIDNKFEEVLEDTKAIFEDTQKINKNILNINKTNINIDYRNCFEVLRKNSYNNFLFKEGGYFLKIDGKGIVIDPGHRFVEDFLKQGHCFSEIDIILISGAQYENTADLELIITLLKKYNENVDDSEDDGNELDRKTVDVYMSSITFRKYSSMFKLINNINCKVTSIEEGNRRVFSNNSLNINAIKAENSDTPNDSSIGFLIEFGNITMLYTGDVRINKQLIDLYTQVKLGKREGSKLVILACLGNFDKCEDKYKVETEDKYVYFNKNHMGRLGLVEINNVLRPDMCIISEFGEELKYNIIDFTKIMNKIYKNQIQFLTADTGLKLIFEEENFKIDSMVSNDVHQ